MLRRTFLQGMLAAGGATLTRAGVAIGADSTPGPLTVDFHSHAWRRKDFATDLRVSGVNLVVMVATSDRLLLNRDSGRQRALLITVPLIRPIISVVVMLSIAGAMRVVDIILVMTKGGPVGSTEVMASYLVNEAMGVDPNYGFGTAISLIIFAFALILTALYQLTLGRNQGGND